METKDQLFLIKQIKAKKRKYLNYISFIKFLAMIKIIKWHIFKWKTRPIKYGARMCEILFVSSGFLVGYNHYKIDMICDFKSSFKYCYNHLRAFYPLLIIIIIFGYFISPPNKNLLIELQIFISNLFMVISWSRYWSELTFFSAHTWFISSLMISYFFTPLLLKGIKKNKSSLILFIIISFIRISIEEITSKASINMLDINFYVGPIIRLFEFYMGMLLIPFFFLLKNYFDNFSNSKYFKITYTIIQLICPIIIYYIMIKYNYTLYRCYFVLIFCVFIFITSYDYGYLSNLFALKIFSTIMSCQMEMYLLHLLINAIFDKYINIRKFESLFNSEIQFLIKLFIIFIISFLYKILFREKLAILFDKLISIFKFII